ncbi:hypothetical protein V2J09_017023, partial [Rumex salicifolius]
YIKSTAEAALFTFGVRLEKENEDLHHFLPNACHGVDKTRHLVYLECFGRADHSKFKDANFGHRFLRAYIHNYEKIVAEKLPVCLRVANKPIRSMTMILNLDGWTLHEVFYINSGWRVLGKNYKEKLLEFIDEDQLPGDPVYVKEIEDVLDPTRDHGNFQKRYIHVILILHQICKFL